MNDAGLRTNQRQRGHRAVELHVAARLENLAMLRTLVGAIGTFEDLDFDAVADLRLAVDEVCTRLIRCATPTPSWSSWWTRKTINWWWRRPRRATPTTWWRPAASVGTC